MEAGFWSPMNSFSARPLPNSREAACILAKGPADCIRRELLEETGLVFDVTGHFYTTDFFQPSAFDPRQQVISIYYFVTTGQPDRLVTSETAFDFLEKKDGAQSLRWISTDDWNVESFTLPIDRVVAKLLTEQLLNKV
jgi:ADP-ribose pyrophosphatase YjhB (NUDIX family)